MADLILPDVSEFQNVTHLPDAAIIRAHNGYRADYKWTRHAEIAKRDCKWWAAYQYLPRNIDPRQAAAAFRSTLGGYKPNAVILDLEEGSGDQSGRMAAWHAAMAWPIEWDYSGLAFSRSHGLSGQVEWIAAYQNTEPSDRHVLWQYTDRHTFPGIDAPCDASVFHGTVADLIALTTRRPAPEKPAATPTPVPTPPPQEDDDMVLYRTPENPAAYEVAGGQLVYVTAARAHAITNAGGKVLFAVVPSGDPLWKLPKVGQ